MHRPTLLLLALICFLGASALPAPAASKSAAKPNAKTSSKPAIAKPAVQAQAAAPTTTGLALQPYLQNPAPDAMTVMWRTGVPSYGWVEYGETPALGKKQDWVVDGLRHANAVDGRARLTGLTPGKTYYYRVAFKNTKTFSAYHAALDEPHYSAIEQFQTLDPAAAQVICCFINDTHNNYPTFEKLAAQLPRLAPDAVLFNGDCFADTASEAVALKALSTYNRGTQATRRAPLYIRGNHETRGAYARQFKSLFDFPAGEFYFALTLGPVRFIMLDCGEDKADDHIEYSGLNDFTGYRQAQAAWLRQELKSEAFMQAKYHVLVHHIPLYGFEKNRFSSDLWLPILKGAPIDLAISAHTHHHRFVKTGAEGNPYPLVIGGGPAPFGGAIATLTVLTADPAALKIVQYDLNGNKLDELTIKH